MNVSPLQPLAPFTPALMGWFRDSSMGASSRKASQQAFFERGREQEDARVREREWPPFVTGRETRILRKYVTCVILLISTDQDVGNLRAARQPTADLWQRSLDVPAQKVGLANRGIADEHDLRVTLVLADELPPPWSVACQSQRDKAEVMISE